jgi:dienelactone hydrolase
MRRSARRSVPSIVLLLLVSGVGCAAAQSPGTPRDPAAAGGALPIALFAYDTAAPLDLATRPLQEADGVAVQAIDFASPKGGRATGILVVPRGRGPFAGVVLQHGLPGNARTLLPRAVELARRGAVVVAIDAPFARRRGSPLEFTPRDSVDQVQLIVDVQRAVDLLLARPDVDRRRLAFWGYSYGAAMGNLVAGIERRLATYILSVGDGGLVAHFTGAEDPPGGPAPMAVGQWERWLAAMRPIEPIRFVHRAPPASILFQSGRRDELVPPADAEVVHAAARDPKTVRWYDAGHGLNEEAERDRRAWLARTIGLEP